MTRTTPRRLLAWAAALASCALTAGAARAQALPDPAALSSCQDPQALCVPVRLHLALDAGEAPVVDAAWVERQLQEARWRFAPLGLDLQVTHASPLPSALASPQTPQDRDALAAHLGPEGALEVFVVARLGDVDQAGAEIRGVHWRAQGRRFLILSKIAPPFVLAHELGHFLGLPHSAYPESVMNKAPREQPPWEQRTFVPAELDAMRPALKKLVQRRALRPLDAPR